MASSAVRRSLLGSAERKILTSMDRAAPLESVLMAAAPHSTLRTTQSGLFPLRKWRFQLFVPHLLESVEILMITKMGDFLGEQSWNIFMKPGG